MNLDSAAQSLQLGKYFPPEDGGVEHVTWGISEGLARLGVRSDVLCFTKGQSINEYAQGYTVYRRHALITAFSTPFSPAYGREMVRQMRRYDLLHLHLPNPQPMLMLCALQARQRLVVHWHGDIVRYQSLLGLFRVFEHRILKKASAIIATSEAYAKASPVLAPFLAKTHVVPIGIAPETLVPKQPLVEAVLSRYPGRKIVFALGRLIYYKGFEYLVRAAAMLSPDYCVVIGGAGPLGKSLKSLIAELKLEDRVYLVGRLDHDSLVAHMAACDVFCLPSIERSEAFGVVMLEAMTLQRPVVATQLPGSGVSWVNKNEVTGLNVAPRNPRELAKAIRRVAENSDIGKRFGSAALERVQRKFTQSKMVEKVAEIYDAVLNHSQHTI